MRLTYFNKKTKTYLEPKKVQKLQDAFKDLRKDNDEYFVVCQKLMDENQKLKSLLKEWSVKTITREQVERMRGKWRISKLLIECQFCGEIYNMYGENEGKPFDFCPACGQPKTDEAVKMVMERLEALRENEA